MGCQKKTAVVSNPLIEHNSSWMLPAHETHPFSLARFRKHGAHLGKNIRKTDLVVTNALRHHQTIAKCISMSTPYPIQLCLVIVAVVLVIAVIVVLHRRRCRPDHVAMSSPCRRHVVAMSSPCRRHVVAVSSPCRRNAVAKPSPCGRRVVAMSSQCRRDAVTMPWACRRHAVAICTN